MATATSNGRGQLSHASSMCSEFDPTSLLANHGIKTSPDDENEAQMPKLPVPPDGGWGWVVVFCSFMTSVIYGGITYSFGIFIDDYAKSFHVSRSLAALLGSVFSGVFSISAPFVCALINNFGCRSITVIGGILTCVAFVAASMCTNYYLFMVLYSLMGSLFLAIADYPTTIAVNYYFERKRAIANGISAAGTGVGAFAMAPISYILIEHYGWRGSMMFLAGIALNCCVFGMPLMELANTTVEPPSKAENGRLKNIEEEIQTTGGGHKAANTLVVASVPGSPVYSRSVSKLSTSPMRPDAALSKLALLKAATNRASPVSIRESENETAGELSDSGTIAFTPRVASRCESYRTPAISVEQRPLGSPPDYRQHLRQPLRLISKISARSYVDAVMEPLIGSQVSVIAAIDPEDFKRPMNREDIFFDGNLETLPEFAENDNDFALYRQNTVSIPQLVTVDPETAEVVGLEEPVTGCQKWLPHAVRDVLRQTFDFSLLHDPAFVTFTAFYACGSLTAMIPYMFIMNRAVADYDIEATRASLLISVIGGANTIGRVATGFVADRIWRNPLAISTLGLFIIGVATLLVPFCTTYTLMTVYAAVFGVFLAVYTSLVSVILVEYFGLDRLTNSYGLSLMLRGSFSMVGPPIGGMIYDRMDSYDATFVYAGAVLLGGVVFGLLLPFVPRKWTRNSPNKSAITDKNN